MNKLTPKSSNTNVTTSSKNTRPITVRLEQSGTLICFTKTPLLLANFPPNIAERFLQLGSEEIYTTHVDILRKGQIGRDMFLICEGKISIWKQNVLLGELTKGDVFGELVIFRDNYRIATVRTEEPTRALRFVRQNLLDFFSRQDSKYFNIYTMNLIEILRRKLITTNDRLVRLEQQFLAR